MYFEIKQYETLFGKVPFREWLHELDHSVRIKIRVRLERMQLGNFGDVKAVGGGVLEVRFHFGSGYRIYFGQDGMTLIVLLCGGDKNSQDKDIQTARSFWWDYNRREK